MPVDAGGGSSGGARERTLNDSTDPQGHPPTYRPSSCAMTGREVDIDDEICNTAEERLRSVTPDGEVYETAEEDPLLWPVDPNRRTPYAVRLRIFPQPFTIS